MSGFDQGNRTSVSNTEDGFITGVILYVIVQAVTSVSGVEPKVSLIDAWEGKVDVDESKDKLEVTSVSHLFQPGC